MPPPPGGNPPAWGAPPDAASAQQDDNGVALGAMVTGIVSLLLAIVGFLVLPLLLAVPGGVVAIVLGVMGRKRARAGAARAGQALTGLLTGIAAVVVSGVWIAIVVVLGSSFLEEFSDEFAELETCIEETGDPDVCNERFSEDIFENTEP